MKAHRLNISFDSHTVEAITLIQTALHVSANWVVRRAVDQYLDTLAAGADIAEALTPATRTQLETLCLPDSNS